MSTRVQMPVRVKPPPAETGEIISPGWASLVMATPEKGARMTVSSMSWRRTATWRLATSTSWRWVSRRAASEPTSASAVSTWDSVEIPSLRSWRRRRRLTRASSQADLGLLEAALGGRGLGLGERELLLDGRGVEAGEHLSLAHLHTLLDVDVRDLAGDLRGDGGLAPRRDIARGVEHGAGRRPAGDAAGGGGAHLGRARQLEPGPRAAAEGEQDDQDGHPYLPAASGASVFIAAIDAQPFEGGFLRGHSSSLVLPGEPGEAPRSRPR